MQLLTAIVKLFLKKPTETQDLVQNVLTLTTQDTDNPDLRDRGYIYWRLLSTDAGAAKDVVLAEKPLISEETDLLEPTLLDELICHISSLASVYHKPPNAFVEGKVGARKLLPPKQHTAAYHQQQQQQQHGEDGDGDDEYESAANSKRNAPPQPTTTVIPTGVDLLGDLLDIGGGGTSTGQQNVYTMSSVGGGGNVDLLGDGLDSLIGMGMGMGGGGDPMASAASPSPLQQHPFSKERC